MTRPFARNGRHHRVGFFTWLRLFSLPRPIEFFISVDHFPIWRRHIAWSHESGDKLRDHMTQRFASNMVFLALMLSSDVAVLFSPSKPSETMRQHLVAGNYQTYDFWAGLFICISMFMIFCSILATFTAWAIVSSISANNAHCILRSAVGLSATQFPSRIMVLAINSFFIWGMLFMFILLPRVWSFVVTGGACLLFFSTVSIYSALGRLVMYTGAMADDRIFELPQEESMLPIDLLEALLEKAKERKKEKTDVTVQYRGARTLQSGANKTVDGLEEGKPHLHGRGTAQDEP